MREKVCNCCGSSRFIAHQLIRADVIVDGNGDFVENLPGGLDAAIYDSEDPYGPYTCTVCGAEYDNLDELWTSVVDGLYTADHSCGISVTTPCRINLKTHEVFDVKTAESLKVDIAGLGTCVSQSVSYDNEDGDTVTGSVVCKDEFDFSNFNPNTSEEFWIDL